MDAEVLAAMLTAGASLLVGCTGLVATWRTAKSLERLKADLAERTAARNARVAYEFDARKRLYLECGPLLFQLSEFAERALGRITGLARTAADGDLEAGRSWLSRGYYSLSTYYRLMAPLAVGKLLRKRLTNLDLSLDPAIHWQYTLIKQIANSFTDDFDLAGKNTAVLELDESDSIDYDPHHDEAEALRIVDPVKYWQQGIPRGILDNAVDALLTRDGDGDEHVIDFREFEERFNKDAGSAVGASFKRIDYLFEDFHPRTRPVLWRILIVQAHLYRALLAAQHAGRVDPDVWSHLTGAEAAREFDWRSPAERETVPREMVAAAVRIADAYVRQTTAQALARLSRPVPAN